MEGQAVVIRDSIFSNLAHGADGTLIVVNSTLIVSNTTFASNSQASAGAIFLNASRVTIHDSLFDHNRGMFPSMDSTHAIFPLNHPLCWCTYKACMWSCDHACVLLVTQLSAHIALIRAINFNH